MGGRGGAGGGIGAGESGRGRGMSLARFLSQQDINRANAASVTDMGDIIRRTFERNAAEINGLELSDAEKKNAVRQMATLATTALKTAAGAVNPYARCKRACAPDNGAENRKRSRQSGKSAR